MENEKIFVIVPVYKVEAYLERCVDSILNQTYINWELVLVDDGSPDNCPAICDRYAAEHDNITVIHQENGGLSAARNAGIDYAMCHGNPKKDWITFIDSDDFVHSKYLKYLHLAATEAGVEISSCGYRRTDATEIDQVQPEHFQYELLTPEQFWCKHFTNANIACGKLYRIFLFEHIQYPVGKLYEDNFTTYKILFCHLKVAVTWMPLYYWYINPASITSSVWTPQRIDQLDAMSEQLTFFNEHGYMNAHRVSVAALYEQCVVHLRFLYGQSPKYDCLTKELQNRQSSAFNLYSAEFGIIKAILIWIKIRIIRPVRRIFRKKLLFSFLKSKAKRLLSKR